MFYLVQNGNTYVWYNTTYYESWQWITPAVTWKVFEIEVLLRQVWSPNFTWNIEVFSNSACTSLIATSETKTLANSTNNFMFNTPFNVVSWTPFYFKVNLVSWTPSTSNFFVLDSTSSSVYAGGNPFSVTNANWITQHTNQDIYFKINKTFTSGLNEDVNKKYIAKAISTRTNKVQWLVNTTVLANWTFNWNIWWLQAWLSSLTEWEVYYLSDAWGLSLSSWTTSVKVGRAISATQINFVCPV